MKEKKKKHVLLKIFLVLFLLLLTAAAGIVIYFYPIYRKAGYLAENLNLRKLDFTLEVRIDRGKLDVEKRRLIDALAEITGITGEELCHLTVQGSVDGDIIYACIYSEGRDKPLTEVYLSDEMDVVNGAMLYGAMRENICARHEVLEELFPVWENHKYMSLKQAEDMFGVDLSILRNFNLSLESFRLSRLQCFGILVLMNRDKSAAGESFSAQTDGMKVTICPQEPIACSVRLESPAEAIRRLKELGEKLSGVGIRLSTNRLDEEKLSILDALFVTLEMNEDAALQVPEDLVSQNMVNIVKSIREAIREF